VSDKAFVLLLDEKCWDAIQEEIKEHDDKDDWEKGMYAQGKYRNHGTNMNYGGWSAKGSNGSMNCDLLENNRY
jgi:hypothetical protein